MTKNPLKEKLKDKKIILGSGSPRRKMFLEEFQRKEQREEDEDEEDEEEEELQEQHAI